MTPNSRLSTAAKALLLSATFTLFSELERIRIARVGVHWPVGRSMEVTEEGVSEAGLGDLLGTKRGVGNFAFFLTDEPAALGAVEESEVHPASIYTEPLQQIGRVRRRLMRRAPQGDAVGQLNRREYVLNKDMDVA